ncbi:MAG: pantoate--beta-alanine ligase [Flavobacteriaceae bacterium]
MLVLKTIDSIKAELLRHRQSHSSVGLVPTMGALHAGHLEIIARAVLENDIAVVSIFVNPTQFNDKSDLKKYPRTLGADLDQLRIISPEIRVFVPDESEMYAEGTVAGSYDFKGLDKIMEGRFRPRHFQGVATIVEKLLRTVAPDRAYFGEKDYQQLQIIKNLVRQRDLNVEIIGCPIIRESNGLAMSSRNNRLSKRLREEASFIYNTLNSAKIRFGTKSVSSVMDWVADEFKDHTDLKLEYFEITNDQNLKPALKKQKGKKYRGFIAVYAEGIRLIDNIALN